MKNLITNFTAMRPNIFSPRPITILFTCLLLMGWANAQSKNDSPASKELHDQIASLDAALFEAYNTCNLDKVGTFFTEDLEYYHEKGGVTTTRKSVLEVMRKKIMWQ